MIDGAVLKSEIERRISDTMNDIHNTISRLRSHRKTNPDVFQEDIVDLLIYHAQWTTLTVCADLIDQNDTENPDY